MIFGILLLITIYFLYILLVKGLLWKLILLIFGWVGLHMYLENVFPGSKSCVINILQYNISWSIFIPSLIVMLAMMTTRIGDYYE